MSMSAAEINIQGVGKPKTRLEHIPVKDIRQNIVMLRPVDRENVEFLELAQSVKKNGVLTAISVREIPDPENPERTIFGIVDGLQRWTAAQDAGFDTIPAQVISIADGNVLEAQILANIHKVETKPAQFTKALVLFLAQNPTVTYRELAGRLSQSESWLSQRLSLNNLHPDIASLVDEGKIVLANAYSLTDLPSEIQTQYIDQAMTQNSTLFSPSMKKISQEIKTAKRQGRPAVIEFTPTSRLQKMSDIKSEQENPIAVKQILMNSGATDPVQVAKEVLAWVLHLDPTSVAADKARWEAKQQEAEKAKEERKKARDEAKLKEAQEAQNGVLSK